MLVRLGVELHNPCVQLIMGGKMRLQDAVREAQSHDTEYVGGREGTAVR